MQFPLIPRGFPADCGHPERQQSYQEFMWLTAGRRFVTATSCAVDPRLKLLPVCTLSRTSADGAAHCSLHEVDHGTRDGSNLRGYHREALRLWLKGARLGPVAEYCSCENAQYRLGDRQAQRLYCDGVISLRAEVRVAGERSGPVNVGSEVKGLARSSDTEPHHQMGL
jgi:hypothetical protein